MMIMILLTVMSLLAGSEILMSRPRTPSEALDMLDPATAVYSPASERRTDCSSSWWANLSEVILYLQETEAVCQEAVWEICSITIMHDTYIALI